MFSTFNWQQDMFHFALFCVFMAGFNPLESSLVENSFSLYSVSSDKFQLIALSERMKNDPRNPLVAESDWNKLKPYFLPTDHPIKAKLDRFFQKGRHTLSKETFKKAGFEHFKIRRLDNIVVGKHPKFPGYIFKVYLDTQPVSNEWDNWIKRIEGARSIRACIEKRSYRHFIAPKKWIYPLPAKPSPPSDDHIYRKNFILIAEDMQILNGKENRKAYQDRLTHEQLNDLFMILTEEGLIDSVYPDNAPFTKKDKIAFVDTEHYHQDPVPYYKLTRFLSPEMQHHWQSLIESNQIEAK